MIKEEPAGEEMQNPTKEFANLKARNEILEKEVKTVRQSINNWRKDSKNISEQILNTVNKDIDSKIEKLVQAKKDLNDDVGTITQNIKQEVFQLDKLGRKSVIDEITKAKIDIIDHVSGELGVDDIEGPNMKEAFVNNLKDELGLEGIKTEQDTFEKSISSLKTSFSNLKQNLKANIKDELEVEFTNCKKKIIEEIIEEFKNGIEDIDGDISDLKDEKDEIKERLDNSEKSVSKLSKDVSSIVSDVLNLKETMKSSKAEKIMTVKNEPSCKNCKNDTCLNGNPVTLENFVELAYCKDKDGDYGYLHMHGEKRYIIYEHGGRFTLDRLYLKYSC